MRDEAAFHVLRISLAAMLLLGGLLLAGSDGANVAVIGITLVFLAGVILGRWSDL